MPPPSVHVELGTSETAQEYEESIFRLYYNTFSKPPYEWPDHGEKEFRRRLSRLACDATVPYHRRYLTPCQLVAS